MPDLTGMLSNFGAWLLTLADKDTWGIVGNWFNGFAALAVVFLALSLQAWFEWRRRPKLKIVYDPNDDNDNRHVLLDEAHNPVDGSGHCDPQTEELWLRINVLNTSKITAREVELRFMYSYKDGSDVKEDRPSWWFKVANLNKFSVAIPPKFKQPFDIAYIKNAANVDDDLCSFLAIVPPDLGDDWQETKNLMERSRENKLAIGVRYRLVFAVVSSNADAEYYELNYMVAERSSHDIPKRNLQTKEVLRRRLKISGPTRIAAP